MNHLLLYSPHQLYTFKLHALNIVLDIAFKAALKIVSLEVYSRTRGWQKFRPIETCAIYAITEKARRIYLAVSSTAVSSTALQKHAQNNQQKNHMCTLSSKVWTYPITNREIKSRNRNSVCAL